MTKPNYAEYSDPKLVAIYNKVNEHYPLEREFFLSLPKEISAKKIIDIGCGTGMLTLELARLGYEVIGVEPAEKMLEIARGDQGADKVKWIHGDALSLSEGNADLAIMTAHVFQFLLGDKYLAKVLSSINSSLKVGGYLAFDSRNNNIKIQDLGWPTRDNPRYFESNTGEKFNWSVNVLEEKNNRATYEIYYTNERTSKEIISVNELIFRSQKEITEYLNRAGFEVQKVYGDWDKSLVNSTSPEFIFVAKKVR